MLFEKQFKKSWSRWLMSSVLTAAVVGSNSQLLESVFSITMSWLWEFLDDLVISKAIKISNPVSNPF